MVLGLLDQLQIFWKLYLIELLGVLAGLGLLELQHLVYLWGFDILVFLAILSLMEFRVRYLALFVLVSVIDRKNIQLMLEFLEAPFLVLHFTYYILMTLMILCV